MSNQAFIQYCVYILQRIQQNEVKKREVPRTHGLLVRPPHWTAATRVNVVSTQTTLLLQYCQPRLSVLSLHLIMTITYVNDVIFTLIWRERESVCAEIIILLPEVWIFLQFCDIFYKCRNWLCCEYVMSLVGCQYNHQQIFFSVCLFWGHVPNPKMMCWMSLG